MNEPLLVDLNLIHSNAVSATANLTKLVVDKQQQVKIMRLQLIKEEDSLTRLEAELNKWNLIVDSVTLLKESRLEK